MTPAYIGLGSNLGDPARRLRQALGDLQALPGSTVERASSIYRSTPLGPRDQPDYCNAVVRLVTRLTPLALLDALQAIERAHGRRRTRRWGPRTLDLDLLLYGDLQLAHERLTLPHPHLHERDFVLYPLREVTDGNLVLPGGADIESLARACEDNALVKTPCALRAS